MTSAVEPKNIIGRVQAILMSPKTEWSVIADEPATLANIYTNYVIILAAIPAVMGFISMSIIGVSYPFAGTFRMSIMSGLSSAIMTYVLSLVGIYIVALIIDALAPNFGGSKNQVQALKAAAYAYTAYWVASIAQIVPSLGTLIVLAGGIYSLYLLYLGLPVTMKSPPERALPYTAVVVLCAIVVGFIMTMVVASVAGGMGALRPGVLGDAGSNTDVQFDPGSPLGQLENFANRLGQAGENLESAQQTGDPQAQQNALNQFLGAALGGGSNAESLPVEQIRSFVPETLGGLQRTDISAERTAMLGIQMSHAQATYSDNVARSLDLEIMDLGGASGLMSFAAWASIEGESQNATGYERTYRQNGRVLHEVWDNESRSGEFGIIAGNRFLVQVSGEAANIDVLKNALANIDIAGLERLAP